MAKSAQFLKEIKERPEKYYIVHYSSESLYDKTIQGNAPRITSIVVIHYATGQITSFAIHTVADILNIPKQNVVAQYDTIEAEMLRQFYDFAAPRAHLSWIHWNMRSVVFGFEHLSHRYEVLTGKKATDIPVESRVNLNDMLRDKYGDLYVPHKQMPNLIHMQGEMPKDYLTGEQEYTGDEYLFHYMPVPPPPNPAHATVSKTEVVFTAGGTWHTSESINQQFDANLATLEDGIARVAKNVTPFNAALRNVIVARLAYRIEIAKNTRQTTQGLKYPLRRLANAPETFKLPEKPKQLTPKPVKVDKSYVLDEADYQNILKICESMSLVMERSSSVFIGVGEEHIRVHYLVQLNGQYQGEATGETFNHIGDTDILIRHENKNVFVAECKFWGGYEAMKKTVDQLLGYTTWRDTRTALIIFNRNLDFTNVISEAQRAMKDHQHYKSGPTNESETRLRYIFSHPEDKQRDIIVTLLLFNMPRPVKP